MFDYLTLFQILLLAQMIFFMAGGGIFGLFFFTLVSFFEGFLVILFFYKKFVGAIFFLVFLGGLLVLVFYVVSSEKISPSPPTKNIFSVFGLFMIFLFYSPKEFFLFNDQKNSYKFKLFFMKNFSVSGTAMFLVSILMVMIFVKMILSSSKKAFRRFF